LAAGERTRTVLLRALSGALGFVALRQNKPAFSGRRNPLAFVLSLRRSARRYLSQRDKFYLAARPAVLIAPNPRSLLAPTRDVWLTRPMRIALAASLAALLLLVSGCGSISSRWNGNYGPYVGVKLDIDQITHYQTEGELIAIADIPLSAIADTLFLPYDLARPNREASTQTVANSNEAPAESDWVPVNRVLTEPPDESSAAPDKLHRSGRVGYRQ
ncbi:MAG TPA: YceK/YidQ family lipoprotein, partial [Methylomirabilota bacterium]|nr:YceK/YidQ family lipoprotein [Methylomirabilota bacterium]